MRFLTSLVTALLTSSPPSVHALIDMTSHDNHLASRRRQSNGDGNSDTSNLPRPPLGPVPYGVDIRACSVPGKMALTFDDGPKMFTAELLDMLASNSVTATFFVLGVNFAQYGSLVRRMFDEGHQVASHSWGHLDMSSLSPEARQAEILNNEAALVGVIGVVPTYFRPPYTACNSDCMADLAKYGYHVTNYNLDTRDWENGGVNSRDIFSNIVDNSDPASIGFIDLAHDVHETTVHGLVQFMIDKARAKGYDLVPLGDCLGDTRESWYRDPVSGASWVGEPVAPQLASSSPSPSSSSSASVPVQRAAETIKRTTITTTTAIPTDLSASDLDFSSVTDLQGLLPTTLLPDTTSDDITTITATDATSTDTTATDTTATDTTTATLHVGPDASPDTSPSTSPSSSPDPEAWAPKSASLSRIVLFIVPAIVLVVLMR